MFDQFLANIRSKSDGGSFFQRASNAAVTKAWLLYKKIHSKNIPMLAFMRKIFVTMLASSRRKKLPRLQYTYTTSGGKFTFR